MKWLSLFPALILVAQPALAQEESEDAPAFPGDLILLPQDVQDAAIDGMDAEEAAIPDGLTENGELWYRAQVAYVGRDWMAAKTYAELAAVAGHIEAAMLAGLIAREGLAGEPDPAAAAQWFQRAADAGEPIALYQLGMIAAEDDGGLSLGTSRSWYERAARLGHLDAMLALTLELRNSPIPQDAITARQWAERAAQNGSAEGMYQFAQMLDAGLGGEADATGARSWYERAADARHAEAALQAALMWAEGEGGPADEAAARAWMRISAESGYAPAQGQYGLMLYQGRGGETDIGSAAYWFSQGALGDDAESQFLYAYVLARGEGVPQDLESAYRWVLEGAVDALGAPVFDPTRDELERRLAQALPMEVRTQIEAAVADGR